MCLSYGVVFVFWVIRLAIKDRRSNSSCSSCGSSVVFGVIFVFVGFKWGAVLYGLALWLSVSCAVDCVRVLFAVIVGTGGGLGATGGICVAGIFGGVFVVALIG